VIDYKTTYTLPPPDDTNALTPKQERRLVKKLNEAIDNMVMRALTGDYYVPSPGGLTLEHVPRRPRLEKKT
jgi:hypothetical protein